MDEVYVDDEGKCRRPVTAIRYNAVDHVRRAVAVLDHVESC